ncbi:MAG: hypothetical protein HKO81_02205 [Flavobacteriaceae bacterium]|nr:hypothetical protein [Flavobacteriaceae bacterium]
MLTISLMSMQCSEDDENSPIDNTAEIQNIVNTAESGNWVVTYFFDADSDETSDYAGYEFTFGANGVLTASNGTNSYTGIWSVTDDSSSDDSSSNDDIDFNIMFVSPPDFEELSDDWDIVSYSSTKIELIDDSGGNEGTDYLTFEK